MGYWGVGLPRVFGYIYRKSVKDLNESAVACVYIILWGSSLS